jgi:Acetyltransferase (GNAT) domain
MERLDAAAFEAVALAFDDDVARSPHIDTSCSATPWGLAASDAFSPGRDIVAWRGDHGWAVFARRRGRGRLSLLEPLEMVWGLGSPLVPIGDPEALANEWAQSVARDYPADVLIVTGLGDALAAAVTRALDKRYIVDGDQVPEAGRWIASLDGGRAGFLSRRSSRFRAHLGQATRKAARAGMTWERVEARDAAGVRRLLETMLDVESRSWKGGEGSGLLSPEMSDFYGLMLPRLARRSAIRALVGKHEGGNIAFIVGSVAPSPRGLLYRGLQFSFDDAYRPLALGNVAQLEMVGLLAAEGVCLYDLGSEVDYKQRWGEERLSTVTLVAVPRAAR